MTGFSGRPRRGCWIALERVVAAARSVTTVRPLHFIFHSEHVGSTLVSGLLDETRVVLPLREPLPLRSLVEVHDWLGEPQSLDGPEPKYDTTCPLLSLPHKLQTTLDTIPAPSSYLKAPAEFAEPWAEKLRANGKRRVQVGIAWSGNPQYVNDVNRSIPLEKLLPLLSTPQVNFISVQKDVRATDEGLLVGAGVSDFRSELSDFAQTAALIEQLDLVISVDTSVAHLAGALGKPVWIALSAVSGWRWLEDRSDPPWYPTARLFCQKQVGDWEPLLAEVKNALVAFVAQQSSSA